MPKKSKLKIAIEEKREEIETLSKDLESLQRKIQHEEGFLKQLEHIEGRNDAGTSTRRSE
jgi:predicted RNase H-like nuclease (RuvC/YqgF family)